MRILWLSNPPWAPSGYGEQSGLFIPRLRALGHEVAVACNWGLHGVKLEWDGLVCYPADNQWGNSTLAAYAEHCGAEQVIALCDAFVLRPDEWPAECPPVACWAPVDHYPVPPPVLAVLAHERVQPLAMSRFGERMMHDCRLDPIYIPHGVDTRLFCPRPEIRDGVRDDLSIPRDAFLVGMVGANAGSPALPRKAFPQAFHAFARFARQHEDAWAYIHTDPHSKPGHGINLDTLATMTGCPAGRLRFPPDKAWQLGMDRRVVANIYQAFDVLLSPSMGEGFGIPILEAQACGVPVIASDHSAMAELTQAGWLVSGDPWWDALQDSFFIVPSIESIVGALEAAYESRADENLRAGAALFAQDYDADLVAERFWAPALDRLAQQKSQAEAAA